MRVLFELVGHELDQIAFHHFDCFARCDAGAVGDAEVVRVHRDGRLAEGDIEHHVCGLAADAGQGFEFFARAGHHAAVFFDQQTAGGDDVFRFRFVEADGGDVTGQAGLAQGEYCFRCVGNRIEFFGRRVDPCVGRLRRQNDRDQQLEG